MSGQVIILSNDKWYSLLISFGGHRSLVEPMLHKYYFTQRAADHILETCGRGIKCFHLNPETGVSTWNDGQYDHSPEMYCSPENKLAKAIPIDYYSGPSRPETCYSSVDDAILANFHSNTYIWDGQIWEYRKTEAKKFKRCELPWSRGRFNK